MTYFYLFLGLTIFILNFYDLIVTVLSPKGAGVLTEKVNIYGSRLYSTIVGKKGLNKLLEYKVIFLILSIIIVWILLTWISCTLIYMSYPYSIVNSETELSSNTLQKLYFTGYTLSTLGPGELKPNGIEWQLFTNFVSFFGFFIITICITYIVPLVSNLTQSKALSLRIAGIGESTQSILSNSYNGENFEELSGQFSSLASDILKYATNHLAYPILHYVHHSNPSENIILKMVCLDETLNIFINNIPQEHVKNPLGLQQLRRSITVYLDTLKNLKPSFQAPPLPDFDIYKSALPIEFINTEPVQLQKIYNKLQDRRKVHLSNVEMDGWQWSDIHSK